MVSSGSSFLSRIILSGLAAMLWVIFTMPHWRSHTTRKITLSPWRTAVSTSCGWKPKAPSPMMQ